MISYINNKNFPFWIFTAGIAVILTVPILIQDGMFLDGMLYTSVSQNLAHGNGTFWQPVASPFYSLAGSHNFHEHPPLAFGIQSLFFMVLGDSMYVERLYVFFTMCITAFLIIILWKDVSKEVTSLKGLAWLPVFLWIIIPTSFWAFTNNMMENTMGIFTMGAVIFAFRGSSGQNLSDFLKLLISGLFVFLATMTKGVPGAFPLAVPFIYWLVFRKDTFLKMVSGTFSMLIIPVLGYFILFSIPESRESLNFYLNERLLQRIADAPTVNTRLYIVFRLFNELIPLFIIILLFFVTFRIKKTKLAPFNKRHTIFFLLTGLAAAAPLALTMVQRGFYLIPSFPYFGICAGIILAPAVTRFRDSIVKTPSAQRIAALSGSVILIIAIFISLSQKGKTSRDRDMLHDVHAIGKTIPANSAITIDEVIALNYSLECYFARYYDIGVHINVPEEYLLVSKGSAVADTVNFSKVGVETKMYDLFKKIR